MDYPTNPVQYGQTSADVRKLQLFLIAQGIPIAAGATGYFGDQTKNALTQWQQKVGITGAGVGTNWGPKSIAAAGSLTNNNSSSGNDATPAPTPTPISPVTPNTPPAPPVNPLDPSVTDLSFFHMSPETYQTNYPNIDPNSPAYQDMLNQISTAFYDNLIAQVTADSEQAKAVADSNWKRFKDEAQQALGISLSGDALQAWNQIEQLRNQGTGQGLGGNQDQIESTLRSARLQDKSSRLNTASKDTTERQKYLRTFASPEQINALKQENPQLAKEWGLTPSDEMMLALSPETMRKKNPNLTDDQIKKYRDEILDENGNYRSTLWQTKLYGAKRGIDLGAQDTANRSVGTVNGVDMVTGMPVLPGDTGIKDIEQASSQFKDVNAMIRATMEWWKKNQANTPSTPGTQFTSVPTANPANSGQVTPIVTPSNPTPTPPTTLTNPVTVPQNLTSGGFTNSPVNPANPGWMTSAEISGGPAGLAAYQERMRNRNTSTTPTAVPPQLNAPSQPTPWAFMTQDQKKAASSLSRL